MNSVTAWSYSRLSQYRKCPRQFRYAVIEKRPQPKSPAMERGTAIHEHLQKYIERKKRKLPIELNATLGPELLQVVDRFRKSRAECELELAVDRHWKPVSWFDRDAWLRVKFDVRDTSSGRRLVDWKTGKVYAEEHAEQLELYALVEWSHTPDAPEILAEDIYVDLGIPPVSSLFTDPKKTVPRLRRKWEKLAAPVFKDQTFKAKPGRECTWCPFSGRRGGPCDKG